jgi:hypothetical protein
MCSCRLECPGLRTPTHSAFANGRDVFGTLWENGTFSVWDLQTRIKPGPKNVMAPSPLHSGSITAEKGVWRQLILNLPNAETVEIVALGTSVALPHMDMIVSFSSTGAIDQKVFKMPSANGRLIQAADSIVWQHPNGELFASMFLKKVVFHSTLRVCLQSKGNTILCALLQDSPSSALRYCILKSILARYSSVWRIPASCMLLAMAHMLASLGVSLLSASRRHS